MGEVKKNKEQALSKDNRRTTTPRGLLLMLLTFALVAYQTYQLNMLSSLSLFTFSTSTNIISAQARIKARRKMRKIQRTKPHLDELTRTPSKPCEWDLKWIENKSNASMTNWTQRIPLIIHQTSKSRCIVPAMLDTMDEWKKLPQYSYYFHDDAAVWRLLLQDWSQEFPHLRTALNCLRSMTAVSDLWRLLVLYEYGGLYVDIDSAPKSWTPSFIRPDDDAYFVVEQFNVPSQYFMATVPRHPVLFYTIHSALGNILEVPNVLKYDISLITGPMALASGFSSFMADVGKNMHKPIYAGLYTGRLNHTIRIEGEGRERSDDIIRREAIRRAKKEKIYKAMNMSHFLAEWKVERQRVVSGIIGRACLEVSYDFDIGPPEWYNASEMEDRETLMGVTR